VHDIFKIVRVIKNVLHASARVHRNFTVSLQPKSQNWQPCV